MNNQGRLVQAKSALKTFIDLLGDDDSLGIVTFKTTSATLTPLTPLGPKRAEVLQAIDTLSASGNTRLIDTVSEVYDQMSQLTPGERIRALVLLSDGDDTESSDPQGAARALKERLSTDSQGYSIKVFTIAYGSGEEIDHTLLEAIAEASGAKSFISGPNEIQKVYQEIATYF